MILSKVFFVNVICFQDARRQDGSLEAFYTALFMLAAQLQCTFDAENVFAYLVSLNLNTAEFAGNSVGSPPGMFVFQNRKFSCVPPQSASGQSVSIVGVQLTTIFSFFGTSRGL